MGDGNKIAGPRMLDIIREDREASGLDDEQRVEPFTLNGVRLYLKSLTAERLAALCKWREANRGDREGLMLRLIAASVTDEAGTERLTLPGAAKMSAFTAHALLDEIVERNRLCG